MLRLIKWLKYKSNREIIILLFPIVAAVAGGAWIIYTHFSPSPAPDNPTQTVSENAAVPLMPSVTADHGGIAIGGEVSNSTISSASSTLNGN